MTLRRPGLLFRRGRHVLRDEGLFPFIKGVSSFFLTKTKQLFFSNQTYYLYEKTLNNEVNDIEFKPNIKNFRLRTISAPQQVDELVAQGFDFSYHAHIYDLKRRVTKGMIIFCAFIDKKIAHISCVAMSEKTKKDIDPLPYAIDYQSEACIGDTETMREYRGLGIYTYVYLQIFQFLKERGLSKAKFTVRKDNIAPQKSQAKLGSKVYGEGHHLKLLWWKFWKKKSIDGRGLLG